MPTPNDKAGGPSTDEHSTLWTRSTAPQSPFTTRHILIGFTILLIGLLITFVIPLLAA